jgi:rubrerythrin
VAEFQRDRQQLIHRVAKAVGGVFGIGAVSSAFAGTAAAAAADGDIDVMQLQTAVSLELLAVATYEAALTLPFIKDGNPVIIKFAETTMSQHDEHRQAFSAQTEALGGTDQTATNPKYTPIVEAAKAKLAAPIDVVELAATLEEAATDTYLADLSRFTDVTSRTLMASVMGVECQHLATLLAVGALLDGGAPELIAIPIGADIAKLPAAAGSVAFPDAFADVSLASPPEEGAV